MHNINVSYSTSINQVHNFNFNQWQIPKLKCDTSCLKTITKSLQNSYKYTTKTDQFSANYIKLLYDKSSKLQKKALRFKSTLSNKWKWPDYDSATIIVNHFWSIPSHQKFYEIQNYKTEQYYIAYLILMCYNTRNCYK